MALEMKRLSVLRIVRFVGKKQQDLENLSNWKQQNSLDIYICLALSSLVPFMTCQGNFDAYTSPVLFFFFFSLSFFFLSLWLRRVKKQRIACSIYPSPLGNPWLHYELNAVTKASSKENKTWRQSRRRSKRLKCHLQLGKVFRQDQDLFLLHS